MAKKTKCKKKHVEDLYNWEMANFIYRNIGDQVMLNPVSIWESLRKAGVPKLADVLLESVMEIVHEEIRKREKEKEEDK